MPLSLENRIEPYTDPNECQFSSTATGGQTSSPETQQIRVERTHQFVTSPGTYHAGDTTLLDQKPVDKGVEKGKEVLKTNQLAKAAKAA